MLDNKLDSRAKGDKSEDLAVEYLIQKGYSIKKRNFTFGRNGEIDVIAEFKNMLIFVEVKSRYNKLGPDPILSINYPKQKSIRKAAEGYLYVNKIENKLCRFDAILIEYDNMEPKFEHLENMM
ncbi:MAG: YraN family protein [Candidatus Kapaibacteriota bacterium]|jgi:putative endonuclease